MDRRGVSAFPCWPETFPSTRCLAGTQAGPAWSVDQQFLGFAPQLQPDQMSRRVRRKRTRGATGDALIALEATDELPPGDRLLGELQLPTATRLCHCAAASAPQLAELPSRMASWVNRSQTHAAGGPRQLASECPLGYLELIRALAARDIALANRPLGVARYQWLADPSGGTTDQARSDLHAAATQALAALPPTGVALPATTG